jgi:hypothetical protein
MDDGTLQYLGRIDTQVKIRDPGQRRHRAGAGRQPAAHRLLSRQRDHRGPSRPIAE